MVIRPFFSALAAVCLGGFLPASAVADVLNGNFETGQMETFPGSGFWITNVSAGEMAGWTASAGGGISADNFQNGPAHGGRIAVAFTAPTALSAITLTQTAIVTVTNAQYALHFWLSNPQAEDNHNLFTIKWNGASVGPPGGIVLGALAGWTEYVVPVTATSTSSTLAFTGFNASGGVLLDDVSLVAIPEPAVAGSFAIGTLVLALRRRRSRSV